MRSDDVASPIPEEIRLRRGARVLAVRFDNGADFELAAEYLRVFSPSAEVRGHGGDMPPVTGKRDVAIERVEPVGHYAVRLYFDDGHNTGLFDWNTLYTLGRDYAANWQRYRERVAAAATP